MIAHATKARSKRRPSDGRSPRPSRLPGGGPAAGASKSRSVLGRRREALFDRVIDYVPCRQFLRADAERLATVPPPEAAVPLERPSAEQAPARGLSPYLAGLYRTRLLTREEEQFYFRRMNWLKFRAATARGRLDRRRATLRQIDQIEGWLAEAEAVKAVLLTSNLRLVVAIAKKFVDDVNSFDDLVGEGNVALMRAVEKFSFALGNRFSTYATYAIQRHFFRLSQRSRRHRSRFVSDDRSLRERPAEIDPDDRCSPAQVGVLEELFGKFLGHLEPRERQIVVARFGFDGHTPRTFRELGAEMGVCKERIRQIQSRAIDKLRGLAAEAGLERTVGDWL